MQPCKHRMWQQQGVYSQHEAPCPPCCKLTLQINTSHEMFHSHNPASLRRQQPAQCILWEVA